MTSRDPLQPVFCNSVISFSGCPVKRVWHAGHTLQEMTPHIALRVKHSWEFCIFFLCCKEVTVCSHKEREGFARAVCAQHLAGQGSQTTRAQTTPEWRVHLPLENPPPLTVICMQICFSINILLFPLITSPPLLKLEMAHLQLALFGLLVFTCISSTAKDKGPA